MKHSLRVALVLACLVPLAAFAQKRGVEDKKAETYNEVEQGFFFGVNGGFFGVLNPPSAGTAKSSFNGQAVQVEVGMDLGERLAPALFFMASANRMGSDYTGLSTADAPATGDFGTVVPGVTLKGRLVGFDDAQQVKRVWVYARASLGYVIYTPSALIPKPDILISVGPGLEYFTRLRHFSIGLEALFNYFATTGAMGFSVFPSVRYAF